MPGIPIPACCRNRTRRRWTDAKVKRQRWSMACSCGISARGGTADMWPDVGHHTIVVGPRYREHIKDIFIRGRLAEDMSL